MTTVGALEIGGTHVTAGVVELAGADTRVLRSQRHRLNSHGTSEEIVGAIVAAAAEIDAPAGPWGVAMPGPFDYAAGVGTFEGAEKFEGIIGYPLGEVLTQRLPGATGVRFLNDAHGFALGEGLVGAARDVERYMVFTIGTGIGSGFVADGQLVFDDTVPPKGEYTFEEIDGHPTEDWISIRALRRRFAAAGGNPHFDVKEIAEAALAGDPVARDDFRVGYQQLAGITARWIPRFRPDRIVVGGSIAGSWALVEEFFTARLAELGTPVDVVPAAAPDTSPLVGAADYAVQG